MKGQSDQGLHRLTFLCIVWMKEQSDQGLHCLPFLCIVWMKEQSDQDLHCLQFRRHLLDAFFYGKVFKFYENYRMFLSLNV